MALAINSNFGVSAVGAVSNMTNSQAAMNKNISRISSGKKAPRPVDDVVSYVRGIELKGAAQKALSQYNKLQDESANLSIMDSAYANATDILLEMQGLVNSGATDESAGSAAFNAMATELTNLASAVSTGVTVTGFSVGTDAKALGSVLTDAVTKSTVSAKLGEVVKSHAALGGAMSALDKIANFLSDAASLKEAQYQTVTEVDLAREMTAYVKNNIQTQAAQSMVAQANQGLAQTINLLQF